MAIMEPLDPLPQPMFTEEEWKKEQELLQKFEAVVYPSVYHCMAIKYKNDPDITEILDIESESLTYGLVDWWCCMLYDTADDCLFYDAPDKKGLDEFLLPKQLPLREKERYLKQLEDVVAPYFLDATEALGCLKKTLQTKGQLELPYGLVLEGIYPNASVRREK